MQINHDMCWSQALLDKDVDASLVRETVYQDKNYIHSLFYFNANVRDDEDPKTSLMHHLRHSSILDINHVIEVTRARYLVDLTTKLTDSISELVYKYQIPIFRQTISGTLETWNIITAKETTSQFKEDCESLGAIRSWRETVTDSQDFNKMAALEMAGLCSAINLTSQERKAILTAYGAGYFAYPHRVRLEDLGRELGLNKTTLSYHLRNAQNKLLSIILNASGEM